jgi:CRISPR-associated protein Cas2
MDWVLSYDIADDRARRRVAKILEDYGDRVQLSVFEAPDLDDGRLEQCLSRVARQLDTAAGDTFRAYPLCAGCAGRIRTVGAGAPMRDPGVYVV